MLSSLTATPPREMSDRIYAVLWASDDGSLRPAMQSSDLSKRNPGSATVRCPNRAWWLSGREKSLVSSGELLGREREVAELSAQIEDGRRHGWVTIVIGEPGIGKSALLAVARSVAQAAGFRVLKAVGVENEMHLPFAGMQQLLGPLQSAVNDLPSAQRDALKAAFGLSSGAPPDLFLIAEGALALLLKARVRTPLIIVVDDVQWLDPQSHQILAFLGYRSAASGVCVLGALRADHSGPFVDAGFPRLVINGLDDESAERMLRIHAGALSAQNRRRIRQAALGNPLALLELPRAWGDGPATDEQPPLLSARLERAFAGRVETLPESTRDALLLAAIGSSSDTDEILSALSAFGVADASLGVFIPAVNAGLTTASASMIVFRHPLVRSGILQRETLARRHAAHHAVAHVLTSDRYRRAWHRAWSMVGPDDDVADDLAATVADSLGRGALMTAVSSLERSAQLTSSPTRRGERLMEAANYAFGAGRADVVARILREAADVDLSVLDRARLVWLSEVLNEDVSANASRVRTLCQSAERADQLGDTGLALNLILGAALRTWWVDSGDDRSRVIGVLDRLNHAADDPRHLAAVSLAEPVLKGYEVARGLRSVDLESVHDGDALRMYGMAAYGVGDFPLATDLLDRAEQAFREQGRLGLLPVVLALQLHIRLDMGDWSGAAAAGKEVTAVSTETGQAVFADNNVLVEARGMALRGQWQEALDLIADAEAEAARQRINDRVCFGYQAHGAALLSAGNAAEAFACLRRQYDPEDIGYHLRESFAGVALMAESAAYCGRVEEGREIVSSLETVAVLTPSPLLEVNLLYARAVLAADEDQEHLFRDALRRDLTRWPWIDARIQLEYGRWLNRVGRRSAALPYLIAAAGVFDRIGAPRWSGLAAEALSGEGGLSDGGSGPFSGLES